MGTCHKLQEQTISTDAVGNVIFQSEIRVVCTFGCKFYESNELNFGQKEAVQEE